MIITKFIRKGDWRTVETFWNAKGTAFFRTPVGTKIKVRYGVGFLGFDRQEQTLNGSDYKRLGVGTGSVSYARMQVKVAQDTEITYDAYGDGLEFHYQKFRSKIFAQIDNSQFISIAPYLLQERILWQISE